MSDSTSAVQSVVSEAEWEQRVSLAACYRLVALFGWDDLIFTHISARVPGPERHFLINPYGLLFGEITASSLVKVDLEGRKVLDSPYEINPAGFTIHSAIHAAREEAHCVLHTPQHPWRRRLGTSGWRTPDLATRALRVVVTRLSRLRGGGAE